MIFHLGYELPQTESKELNCEIPSLTGEETRIIKTQIRKNTKLIDQFIARLDLLVNQEGHPNGEEKFVEKIRDRLLVLMSENDTFRNVLWQHFQQQDFLKRG